MVDSNTATNNDDSRLTHSDQETTQSFGELFGLQADLLEETRRWATTDDVEERAGDLRAAALNLAHQRYSLLIPKYKKLATGLGLHNNKSVHTDDIINELMFDDRLFKSYPPNAVADGEYAVLSEWLGSICSQSVPIPSHSEQQGFASVSDWRTWLASKGIHVSYSSGTSGKLSFVPRDPITWRALNHNSRVYADNSWFTLEDGSPRQYDCLIAGPPGDGMGILGAASGLSRTATRSHYLYPTAVTEEMATSSKMIPIDVGQEQGHLQRAIDYIREGIEEQRPLLLFGAPYQLKSICEKISAICDRLATAPGSIVVSGGGWKTFADERLPPSQLFELIEATFGIQAQHVADTYSTTELNCAFVRCPHGSYHIPPLIEPVILDERYLGTAGAEGTGIFGFLDVFAMSYPGFIITGDHVTLLRDGCRCGRPGWRIHGEIVRAAQREVKGCGGVLAAITA